MKNKLTKLMVTSVVSVALTMASQAQAESTTEVSSKVDDVMAKLVATLKGSTPSIAQIQPTLSPIAQAYVEKMGDDYIPIMFGGRRFLADSEGKTLTEPNSLYIINGDGVVRAGDILVDMDFQSPRDWPTLELPPGVVKQGDLYVVSDPTCGYCNKVDDEAFTYLENGIQVHYIPWPRSGLSTNAPAYQKWAAAVCSENPGLAYHEISLGKGDKYEVPLDMNSACLDIIKEGYNFGLSIGVSGTPFMYGLSTDGTSFAQPGYVPVKDFAAKIGVTLKSNGLDAIMGK